MKPLIPISAFSAVTIVLASFPIFDTSMTDPKVPGNSEQLVVQSEETAPESPADRAEVSSDAAEAFYDLGELVEIGDPPDIAAGAAAVEDPMARGIITSSTFNPYGFWWPERCEAITGLMRSPSTHDEAVAIVNETRARYGIAPVTADPALIQTATQWSQHMGSSLPTRRACGSSLCPPTTYAHDPLLEAITDLGYRRAAENIRWFADPSGWRQDSDAAAVCSWLGSATGHREALLSTKYSAIGIGGAKFGTDFLWTSHLGGDKRSTETPTPNPTPTPTPNPTPTPVDPEPVGDHIVLRSGSVYQIRYGLSAGVFDQTIAYGKPDDVTFFGDWDGDGVDGIAVRRGNVYYFKNTIGPGMADYEIVFGRPDDDVFVGDWDGDGKDTLTVRRGTIFYVSNTIKSGLADQEIVYGKPGDTILVGDWDGNGTDTLAVRRGAEYHFKNAIEGGLADNILVYGRGDDQVLVGDWDNDKIDTLAVRRGNIFYISNDFVSTKATNTFALGNGSETAFAARLR